MKKLMISLLLVGGTLSPAAAEKYAAILKDAKVYEEADPQGFVAQNMKGKDITVSTGMVFEVVDEKPGWYVVEYSPGIRGFLVQSFTVPSGELQKPEAGDYPLSNNKEVIVNVAFADGAWTLSSNGLNLSGQQKGNVVAFSDKEGNMKYSLVKFGGKNYIFDYSNDITHFF